jgi:hypothetical protein
MEIDLTKYTESELLDLNPRIIERLRFLRQGRCRESMAELNVGDRVSFLADYGREVVGTIIRLNRKSVTLVSTEGVQWRVAPTLVKRAEAERESGARLQVDLIEFVTRQRDRGKA